jgi:hypothetical protein
VPYRDHPLTRLLQTSLGGNSQALLLAHASSLAADVGEVRVSLSLCAWLYMYVFESIL